MRILKNHKGFSVVEMIVVVAIIGMLAGVSLVLMNQISVANVDKTVQTLSMALNKLQLDSMSKADQNNKFCVYLFRTGDGYYFCRAKKNDAFDMNTMKAKGTYLGGGITVSTQMKYAGGTGDTAKLELASGSYLKIAYLRDGSLDGGSLGAGTDLLTFHIFIDGKGGREIIINKDTGKLIVQ